MSILRSAWRITKAVILVGTVLVCWALVWYNLVLIEFQTQIVVQQNEVLAGVVLNQGNWGERANKAYEGMRGNYNLLWKQSQDIDELYSITDGLQEQIVREE